MLSICAAMIQLARNPYPKQVLQAIANPNRMILWGNKGTQDCKYEMQKRKGGNEGMQICNTRIYQYALRLP